MEHFQGFNILKYEIAADIRTEGCLMDIQILVSGWKDLVVSWDITQCRNCTFQNDEQSKLFNTLKIIINIYICSTTSVKHFKPAEKCSSVKNFQVFIQFKMKIILSWLNNPEYSGVEKPFQGWPSSIIPREWSALQCLFGLVLVTNLMNS